MITFSALPTDIVRAYQSGAPDAYGAPAERAVSNGAGNPCRHCLRNIPEGADMLILAHRPFDGLHPYAETGPIFLCAEPCERHTDSTALPPVLTTSPDYLIKGYGRDDRIVYGTGAVVPTTRLAEHATRILDDPKVAYVHVRSARNNCYQARVERKA
jgi:hypothetical protein